jgi:Sulfotransferase domain
MLPNFIGIGGPKCGSTWLHDLLQSHPNIYMPKHRKELYFFNSNYERGADWYETYFPRNGDGGPWQAVGEITPVYMYDPAVPGRLQEFGTVDRLIAILRHPVDRLYSQYVNFSRVGRTSLDFRDFVNENPMRIKMGRYAEYIAPFLDHFDRSQILILIMEDSVSQVEMTKGTLSRFLGVDASKFPNQSGTAASNAGITPDHKRIYLAAHGVARKLRDHRLDWVVSLGNRLGLKRSILGKGRKYPPLADGDRAWLMDQYTDEFEALETQLGLDISTWRGMYDRQMPWESNL